VFLSCDYSFYVCHDPILNSIDVSSLPMTVSVNSFHVSLTVSPVNPFDVSVTDCLVIILFIFFSLDNSSVYSFYVSSLS